MSAVLPSDSDATRVGSAAAFSLTISIPKDTGFVSGIGAMNSSASPLGGHRRRSFEAIHEAAAYLGSAGGDQQRSGASQKQQQRRNSNIGCAAVGSCDGDGSRNGLPALDGYTVISRIGQGAFSTVYRARKEDTGEDVAIKAIRKTGLSAVQEANIRKEVAIMDSLHHPRIIRLLDFREARDYYYLIMEYAEGGELFDRVLQLTYLSEKLARHVIIQVAEAVRYLHANGVVQRDLKLENVVFEPIPVVPSGMKEKRRAGDLGEKQEEGIFVPGVGGGGIGRVKLIDFGLSKVVWNQATHTPCGTTGYAAPEIVRDELYTKSVDMWGLGCMLYALICGFPPFYDEDAKVLTRKVAMGQYEFLSPWWDDVNPQVKHLISHLLELDPRRRYTIDDFMRHPWIREGISEMYGNDVISAAAHASVNKRRHGARRMAPHLGGRGSNGVFCPDRSQFSPKNTMKCAYDLAYAMRRLGDDESAHQWYANTPAWDAAFGPGIGTNDSSAAEYGCGLRSPGPLRMAAAVRDRAREKTCGNPLRTPLWVDIQAVASPIHQRHCWQGTLGSPIDVQTAEADLNLISKALEMPIKKPRIFGRNRSPAGSVSSQESSSSDFTLNMRDATLLKRRHHV
ncbi:Pkinase-domain-containing protein [Martensiomyces pterosporus]|nr:Pkinase-domain-containing protein [Martensiomyces pterosporus]